MKTYLIKKEFKSIWIWALIAMAIQFICFIFSESIGSSHSLIEVPHLMLSGNLRSYESPLFGNSPYVGYFWIISILTAIVLAIVQIYPEINNKTIPFLLHRPVSKSEIINAKIASGLFMLIFSIGIPFSFIVLTCLIPGNYPAPFEIDMMDIWVLCIYLSCCIYFAVFYCCLQEGKFLKWITLFSLPVFCWLILLTITTFTGWFMMIILLTAIIIWYLAIKHTFEERDF